MLDIPLLGILKFNDCIGFNDAPDGSSVKGLYKAALSSIIVVVVLSLPAGLLVYISQPYISSATLSVAKLFVLFNTPS